VSLVAGGMRLRVFINHRLHLARELRGSTELVLDVTPQSPRFKSASTSSQACLHEQLRACNESLQQAYTTLLTALFEGTRIVLLVSSRAFFTFYQAYGVGNHLEFR
jgi:hypothetical protein